jgi:hypothetical protein
MEVTWVNSWWQFFEAKKDHLYQIEIFYAIVLEGRKPASERLLANSFEIQTAGPQTFFAPKSVCSRLW